MLISRENYALLHMWGNHEGHTYNESTMPRHANFQNVDRLDLSIMGNFGIVQYNPNVPNIQLYQYYNVGRFLYFRFDERNCKPKSALQLYNQEWLHHQLGVHLSAEAKRVFFRVRDSTQQNFF